MSVNVEYDRPTHSIDVSSLKNALGVAYNPTTTWVISKYMVSRIGANETIMLMELGSNINDGMATFSREDLKKWTSFSYLEQIKAETNLIELGLLEIRLVSGGMSRSNHYTLNHENINSVIEGNEI